MKLSRICTSKDSQLRCGSMSVDRWLTWVYSLSGQWPDKLWELHLLPLAKDFFIFQNEIPGWKFPHLWGLLFQYSDRLGDTRISDIFSDIFNSVSPVRFGIGIQKKLVMGTRMQDKLKNTRKICGLIPTYFAPVSKCILYTISISYRTLKKT